MPRKRKSDGDIQEVKPLKRHKPPADRNIASPSALVTACKDMPEERTSAIDEMAFTSLRNIKCDNLFNRLSQWLAGLYDPDSREVVIPGRGRLPVNEESVHRIMGVPRGDTDVEYHVPTEAQLEIAADLFGDLGHAPKTMDVLDLILKTDGHDDNFKRLWLVLAASTVMAPTTSNKISTRWYPVLENIGNVQNLNWCKFIADQLHKALSKGKPTTGCLLFYNLLYIDAIDLTGLGIRLPNGPFAINVWTNELASKVLQMDVQRDKLSYGKLPLKPQFGQDYCLFGGLQGLDKFMRVHVPPNCSEQKFAKAAAIVGRFSSGMVGLMGGLVTDFMTLDDEENSGLSRVLESQLRGLSAAAGKTARTACATRSRERRDTGKQNIELSDYDCEADDGGGDAHSDDDPDYHVYFHGPSGGFEATGSGGPNAHEASGSGAANANLAASGAAFEDLSARVDGNDGNTTPVAGTDQPIESQIMISARSGTVSGDGVDNHPEMTDTQNEAAIDASVKRCGSALVHNLEKQKQYSRRHKKLRLPSPVLPTVSEQPSLDDTHRFIKGIVISELGLVCSDKGTASVIAEPTRKKQQPRKFSGAPSASAASLSINPGVTSEVAASVSQARSHISSSADVDSSDTSFSKKTMKTVRKVRVSSQASSQARLATRSSPRFAAKDPKERPNVDIEGSPKATSLIAILQDDSPVIISPDAGCGAVQELSAAANIAEVVEEFANVVISTEAESSVDQAQGKAPTGSASVAKDVQVEAQVDPVQVTVPEPVGVETQNDAVKDSAAGAVGVETQDAEVVVAERADWDFTPPSCSLGLGFTPPVPDVPTTSAVLTAVPAPAVNMAPQEPPAATPVVHMTTTAQVPAAVLALQSVTSQDLKKAGDKPIDAKPVSWAEPSESERRVRVYDADVEDDEVLMWVEQVESASARAKANNASQKDHPISPQYVTPVIQPPKDTHPEYIHSGSVTPKSFLRKVRVTRPSQFLLPPYCGLTASDLEEAVYAEVIKHSSDSVDSKIKHIRVIDIDGRWVTLEELANSVKEGGQVSNNVAEMHIRTLADSVPPRKIIFPWLLSVYLLLGDTKSKCLIKYFRRDVNYILSHQHQLLFPTLQKLGSTPKEGHWFVLCLNLKAKRFEVLDSLRTEDDPSLILHATKLMNGVKKAWLLSYKDSSKQIQDYDLVYIDVFKQDNGVDCGFFAFKILEFWDGKNIPAITQDQIPALRKILTSMWLEHPRNKCKQWRYHLFNQK